ncbi:MAG: hypothetical protein D6780_05725 [Candidatus Dadabacteria bacterium]|nr:MAG: hypothetical protein D6780_05725 [Candidatus Dadabacteria bacterium]
MKKDRSNYFVRLGKLGEEDKREVYEYWDKLGDEARFKAAWELVIEAYKIKGKDLNELRFQRSVEKLVRKQR